MTATPVSPALAQLQVRVATIEARLASVRGDRTSTTSAAFDHALRAAGTAWSSGPVAGSVTAAELRDRVQGYVGIPYVWGGTDPATGLDCSGFVQHLFRGMGVELPRVSADQLRTGAPVADLASARPGDLLGWDTGPRNEGVDHVAVYLGDGMMAEAPGRAGGCRWCPCPGPRTRSVASSAPAGSSRRVRSIPPRRTPPCSSRPAPGPASTRVCSHSSPSGSRASTRPPPPAPAPRASCS